jgi:prevent-host-death family protein
MQKIMPITDLQRAAGNIIADLTDSDESVVITHRGRPAAVLLSVARYEEIEGDLQRLDDLELLDMVAKARQGRAAGQTIPHEQVKTKLAKKFTRK